ncbi:MAG: haloacid dehalogenase [Candidatus Flexifilum sp.]
MTEPVSLAAALEALQVTADAIREDFSAKNTARDTALARSRELIRRCAEAIRALHRRDWAEADARLALVGAGADAMRAIVAEHADLYSSGYTQDALKEVVEAYAMAAIIRGERLPTPAELRVDGAVYLNGLAEAATELRRFILDILRRDDGDTPEAIAEAERLLTWMDAIYDHLVTFDFPDAITGDLRRRTDAVRAVLERTRGDLTTTMQQQRLQAALQRARGDS